MSESGRWLVGSSSHHTRWVPLARSDTHDWATPASLGIRVGDSEVRGGRFGVKRHASEPRARRLRREIGSRPLKVEPFAESSARASPCVMATEGAVHSDKDHVWHMNTISSLVHEDDGLLMRTPYQVVDLADPASEAAATAWWENLTETGGEGAVVKPLQFVATTSRGLLQTSGEVPRP